MGAHRSNPARLAVWLALSLGAAAQVGAAVPERVSDRVEVRVVEIDVFVGDRKGRPVDGLGRDDFTVRLDGAPIEIVNFYAAGSPAAGPPAASNPPETGGDRPLRLVLYVDSSNVDRERRNEALEAVRDVLRERLGPRDRVLVAAADRSTFDPRSPFTDRLELIELGLRAIEATPAQDRAAAEFSDILRDIHGTFSPGPGYGQASVKGRLQGLEARIRVFADEMARESARAASNLRRLVDALSGLPGKRAILFVGGGLAAHPGEALSQALGQALGRYGSSMSGSQPSIDRPASSFADVGSELSALAKHAGARGVAFYALDVGEASGASSAGLSRDSLAGGASAPGQEETWAPGVGFGQRSDRTGPLELLARTTGGLAMPDGRYRRLVERLFDDRRSAYSLGIRAPAAGAIHRLDVSVAGRGREARHRRVFRLEDGDEASAARVAAALMDGDGLARVGENPLEVRLESGEARPADGGLFSVPLSIQVPVASLAVEARGTAHAGQVTIFVAAGTGVLAEGPVKKAIFPVTLENASILDAMGRVADYRLELEMRRGPGRIAVGVRDDLDPRLSIQVLELAIGETAGAARF